MQLDNEENFMNHLQTIHRLRNRYFALRHGESRANVQGIILSSPTEGLKSGHSLTPAGGEQVAESVRAFKRAASSDGRAIIISSPFSRAMAPARTAQWILAILEGTFIGVEPRLRERWFGQWEATSNQNYDQVWEQDALDPNHTHTQGGVESVNALQERVISLIIELEQQFKDEDILLVSHGGPLQVLQTGLEKISAAQHRSLSHFQTGQIRELTLTEKK